MCGKHTTVYRMDNQQGPTVEHREVYSILCNDLHGKRILKKKKRIHIYVELIHFAVHLKLTQHCKSTILQLKKKRKCTINKNNNNTKSPFRSG